MSNCYSFWSNEYLNVYNVNLRKIQSFSLIQATCLNWVFGHFKIRKKKFKKLFQSSSLNRLNDPY